MIGKEYNKMLDNPPPSKKENMALIRRVQDGDKEAAWDLVCANARMVANVISKHAYIPYEDESFSDGLWGFYKAVDNLKKDIPSHSMFHSFCEKYIYGYIMMGLNARTNQFKRGDYRPSQTSLNREYVSAKGDNFGDNSFLRPIDPTESQPHDNIVNHDDKIFSQKLVDVFLNSKELNLTNNQKKVLKTYMKHHGNGAAAARELGVTRERVRVAKNVLTRKVKKFMERNKNIKEELFNIIK